MKVGGILVHLRRAKDIAVCAEVPARVVKLRATEPVQETYDRAAVVGPCGESGLKAKPALQARLTIQRNGQHDYVLVVPEGQRLSTPDGVTVALNSDGVITMKAPLTYRWQSEPFEGQVKDKPTRRHGNELATPTLGRPPAEGRAG